MPRVSEDVPQPDGDHVSPRSDRTPDQGSQVQVQERGRWRLRRGHTSRYPGFPGRDREEAGQAGPHMGRIPADGGGGVQQRVLPHRDRSRPGRGFRQRRRGRGNPRRGRDGGKRARRNDRGYRRRLHPRPRRPERAFLLPTLDGLSHTSTEGQVRDSQEREQVRDEEQREAAL